MITSILLTIFIWQVGVVLIADENIEAEKFGKLWDKWLEDTNIKLD